ncbi:hypothetical protein CHL76_10235 [Marinococcus halophilus]|uniref:Intracellular proteinase inhibitor BsuPI domain-containing protein n=1 Tax=Marinococcus halophilus TaxID=1371 RepID=A0A510Y3T5_MARHA|nr:BsuPI-related putative proteinase inhibitor [Marinococcus halophilus]OZT80070.1 hypothetical protein CHL76_10235 [Marinococcus halophilus]GEK58006.1 hypothetical protein MHA01_09110 [Marinococcus halophilus]
MAVKKWLAAVIACFCIFPAGCGSEQAEESSPGTLEASMEENTWTLSGTLDTENNTWHLEFENTGNEEMKLNFQDGQEAEVIVKKEDDSETVYVYSEGKVFTQAEKSVEVSPGNKRRWDGELDADLLDPENSYQAEFQMLAENLDSPVLDTSKNP